MGRVANVDLLHNHERICGLCGMEKSDDGDNGCCKDETETLKISIDQKTSALSHFHFEQPFTDLIAEWVPVLPGVVTFVDDKVPPLSHAPPRTKQVPIYLMHSIFLI
jgi:hypothetical protein